MLDTLIGMLAGRVSGRLANRILLPGLLFVAIAGLGGQLGQAHWADPNRARQAVDRATNGLAGDQTAGLLRLLLVLCLLALAAGFVVFVAGYPVGALWFGRWPRAARRLRGLMVARRRAAWIPARDAYQRAAKAALTGDGTPDRAAELRARMAAIAEYEPEYPTWAGDRMRATQLRVREVYGLDLGVVWSRLWLVAPDPGRSMVTTAGGDLTLPQMAAGWGLAYLVLGVWWWPAFVIGAALGAYAWMQARRALGAYLNAVETLVDLYGQDLARAVGVASVGPRLAVDEGTQVNRVIGKGA